MRDQEASQRVGGQLGASESMMNEHNDDSRIAWCRLWPLKGMSDVRVSVCVGSRRRWKEKEKVSNIHKTSRC